MDSSAENNRELPVRSPTRFLGAFFQPRAPPDAAASTSTPTTSSNALLPRVASIDDVASLPGSGDRRHATQLSSSTNALATSSPPPSTPTSTMPLFRLGGGKQQVAHESGSAPHATPPEASHSEPGSHSGNATQRNGHTQGHGAVSPTTNHCAPLMRGYRQCLEVNPDAKVNCTWALDKYMKCQEMHDTD